MPSTARVLVIELVMPERVRNGERPHAYLIDLEMLTMTNGGRERTEKEFADLFRSAGLSLAEVIPTASRLTVLVGEIA
jgi:hypothetical protein